MRIFNRQRQQEIPLPGESVIEQLRDVRQQLEGIENYFELESDEDLIDAAIYLRESLQARERYLLRQAREQNVVAATLPIETESRERFIN